MDILATSPIQIIVILIAIDVVLGIVAAFLKKEFVLGKVGGFMKRGVLKYVLGFALIELVGLAQPSLSLVVSAVFILVVAALLGSILDNLAKLGLPVPKILRK